MEVRFDDDDLEEVDAYQQWLLASGGHADPNGPPPPRPRSIGKGKAIDQRFSDRMTLIRSATDERDFKLRSLHFEPLKGNRQGEYSMRLNDQWRLVFRFEGQAPKKTVVITGVEDYH